MFANFFGIVIISASILLIAGLVLRPTPDLPAMMNLGLVDKLGETAPVAAPSSVSDTTDATTSSAADSSNSTVTATTGDAASDNNSTTGSDTAQDAPAKPAIDTAMQPDSDTTKPAVTDNASAIQNDATDEQASPVAKPSNLSEEYLEIRRRAIEKAGSAHTRTNKSDGDNKRNQ